MRITLKRSFSNPNSTFVLWEQGEEPVETWVKNCNLGIAESLDRLAKETIKPGQIGVYDVVFVGTVDSFGIGLRAIKADG